MIYVITVGPNNKDESRKVQNALFKVGFTWACGDKKVRNTEKSLLMLNQNQEITFWDRNHKPVQPITNSDVALVTPEYVINHADELEGAKVPEEHKQYETAYKVVCKDNDEFVSLTAGYLPASMLRTYNPGEKTVPLDGSKLFVFKSYKMAEYWVYTPHNYILKGVAENLENFTGGRVPPVDSNEITSRWKDGRPTVEGKTIVVPEGTYLCDSFIPLEICDEC